MNFILVTVKRYTVTELCNFNASLLKLNLNINISHAVYTCTSDLLVHHFYLFRMERAQSVHQQVPFKVIMNQCEYKHKSTVAMQKNLRLICMFGVLWKK